MSVAKRTNYINKKMIVVINRLCISWTGGVRNSQSNMRKGANLSFVEQIFYNHVYGEEIYPDKYHLAAAYMFYIIKNHVFNDGNKRTGLVAAITFLQWNGIVFNPFDEDAVFYFVMSIAEGENNPDTVIPKIATWLHELSLQQSNDGVLASEFALQKDREIELAAVQTWGGVIRIKGRNDFTWHFDYGN